MTDPLSSSAAKQTFSSIASHALRGVTFTILGSLSALDLDLEGESLSQRQRLMIGNAAEGAARLAQAVKDLEILLKDADHQLEDRREVTPLGALIDEAIAQAQEPIAPDPPRAITRRLPSRLAACYADRRLARRALAALIENALRFSPPDAPIGVEASRRGDRVVIRVLDAGDGVGPDERERIFEPLYVGADPQGDVGLGLGVGLGLAVARVCAKAQGGAVSLERSNATGASFILELMLSPPDAPANAAG
ncbi:MAG TPA: HAMP domain-containing sensor histidine kinase [Ktedonobacterales bacterium]|jgi:two-component system sensor histidine kinase KdpD